MYKKNKDNEFVPTDIYNGRSYDLFGILAGVRSCTTPFVYPRGVPDNLSPEVFKRWHRGEEDSWHTPTWYGYCELKAYQYAAKYTDKYAKLSLELYKLKNPEEYQDDFDLYEYDEDDYSTSDLLDGFINCIDTVLEAYGIYYPKPNEIRVIMWFDS